MCQISLQTGSNVIKPRRVYAEAEFLALAKFLMIQGTYIYLQVDV